MTGKTSFAMLDFTGNRQYISAGNLATNNKASVFLLDQVNRKRLKIQAEIEILPKSDSVAKKILNYQEAFPFERILKFNIKAFDWNCPKHIHQRWKLSEFFDIKDEEKQKLFFQRMQEIAAEMNEDE